MEGCVTHPLRTDDVVTGAGNLDSAPMAIAAVACNESNGQNI
jgi:hypothetical protein